MAAQYIKDLLDLPPQINKGDFVLKLTAGVDAGHASQTLRNYVVTPQLLTCFEQAMGFIRGAVESTTSKACYLHGSFGSGKSHFMAVLHLLLQGNPEARAMKDLAPVVAKSGWAEGKKFLLVPFHMIGSRSMEAGILGQYAAYVRQKHPEAPVPGVYLAGSLFEDAKVLRQQLGDATFFGQLNAQAKGEGAGKGWGKITSGRWDAAAFDVAVQAPPGDKASGRSQLIGDLIATYFRSYHNVAAQQEEAFLDLDKGLEVITQHAQALGYDGLILFLDELILWLAGHAADLTFIHRETQKLVKLVEGQNANRPIPLVSFVARQRDLRKLIGETVPGAQRLNFDDSVDWSDGRFEVIKLEDRNLPLIANKRVLRPRSEAARQELDAAFEQTAKVRKEVMEILLANEYNPQEFRLIYPFSPALMETLVAASSMLQRERTALKVMMQLLVKQQETLKVGDIVPVGDLYDQVAEGDEAFSPEMKVHFDNARKLYNEKLLPMLEAHHGRRREEFLALPVADPARVSFLSDDRLMKTLLLAALVPGVPTLRNLTVSRLAALNHGTIRSPIPGKEFGLVAQKCRQWAAEVGEIKVGDDPGNPTVSIQLSGVDVEAILAAATQEDNPGNQMRLVRDILFSELGIANPDEMFITHEFTWHNTPRECDIVYNNVASMSETSLTATGDRWKVVIDYPFDDPGRTARDDVAKLAAFAQNNPGGTRTIVWLPAFFSATAMRDLGRLVVIAHVLTGTRFDTYASFLSPQNRVTARNLLESMHSALRGRVREHIEAAYGIRGSTSRSVDTSHELADTFRPLYPGLDLQPPAASNLRGALEELLGQALAYEFPGHPAFGAEIKPSNVRKVYDEVIKATTERDGRALVDKSMRSLLKQVAEPLGLGEQGEQYFLLSQRWRDHLERKARETSSPMTVRALRNWIDEPKPMGLPSECANLIILIFAAQTNRSFYLNEMRFDATLANLREDVELRTVQMPAQPTWELAVKRAGSILGVTASPLRNAANLAQLAELVQTKVAEKLDACRRMHPLLEGLLREFGVAKETAARWQTADAVLELVEALREGAPAKVVEVLAASKPRTSEEAMGASFAQAAEVLTTLTNTPWRLFENLRNLQDQRKTAATAILERVKAALVADQYAQPLAQDLRAEQGRAIDLLAPPPSSTPVPAPPVVPPPAGSPKGKQTVSQGSKADLDLSQAEAEIRQLKSGLKTGQHVRVSLSWVVEQ